MTIEKEDTLAIVCDSCSQGLIEAEEDEKFKELWERAKKIGWRAKKEDDDEWVHSCPECVDDE